MKQYGDRKQTQQILSVSIDCDVPALSLSKGRVLLEPLDATSSCGDV
jgi:hypothetical protein